MKVTGFHTSCLDRQVTERVNIENFQGQVLMNRRNEMGGVRLDRIQEVGRGLKGTRMEVPPPFANLQASRGAERR